MTIPKGTQVIPLIHAVHMDPALWKDPEVFNPERFLSACGTRIVKPDFFMPFGVGRRMCLGDVLAKAELFLFFSSMLHVFNLRVPDGADEPTLNGQAGVTVSPQSFKVSASFGEPVEKKTQQQQQRLIRNLHHRCARCLARSKCCRSTPASRRRPASRATSTATASRSRLAASSARKKKKFSKIF